MKFYEEKPFGIVYNGNVSFEQNGHFFNINHENVDIDGNPIKEIDHKPVKIKAEKHEAHDATI